MVRSTSLVASARDLQISHMSRFTISSRFLRRPSVNRCTHWMRSSVLMDGHAPVPLANAALAASSASIDCAVVIIA